MQTNTKWTAQEDNKLVDSVRKYGTQWATIIKQFNNERSQNAITKRWHGHLKHTLSVNDQAFRPRPSLHESGKDDEESNHQSVQEQQDDQQEYEQESKQKFLLSEKSNCEIIGKIIVSDYQYRHHWNVTEDNRLKNYIVSQSVFNWEKLAQIFGVSSDEIKFRWIKAVYPTIRKTLKIGGAVKWSSEEDTILCGADRQKISYLDLMFFLPERTVYSIQARWRRMIRNSDGTDHCTIMQANSTHFERRDIMCAIARKRKRQKQVEMDKIYLNEDKDRIQHKYEAQKHDYMFNKVERYKDNDRDYVAKMQFNERKRYS